MRQSDSDASSDDDVLLQPLTPVGPTPPLSDPAQPTAWLLTPLSPTQPLSDPAQSTARLLTPVGPPHPFQTLLSGLGPHLLHHQAIHNLVSSNTSYNIQKLGKLGGFRDHAVD